MSKKYILWVVILCIKPIDLMAQIPSIQLDRPDQTECPFIVPVDYIQVENGFTYENVNKNQKSIFYPSSLWKYGLSKRFEFRLITELVSQKAGNETIVGLNPITIGFKGNICQEKGLIPVTSFIGHLTTANVGSKEFHTSYIAPSFRFTMQHTLSNKISLAYNLGAKWDGETRDQTYLYTLTMGTALSEKLGGYIEIYGYVPRNEKSDHRFDCGFTYLINNDLMMDLSAGFGLTDNSPKSYLSLGISYRIKVRKGIV
jgi:Putative MetA-pathway of phenol degradation